MQIHGWVLQASCQPIQNDAEPVPETRICNANADDAYYAVTLTQLFINMQPFSRYVANA